MVDYVVHFFRLLAVSWPGTQSARDNDTIRYDTTRY